MRSASVANLVGLGDLSDAVIGVILGTTERLAGWVPGGFSSVGGVESGPSGGGGAFRGALAGLSAVLLFFEDSTRTRASFELAAGGLGMRVVNLEVGRSSVTKGESFDDMIGTLAAMGSDVLVIRHGSSGAARRAARVAGRQGCVVVNAGSGVSSHPTQALLDAATMRRFVVPALGGSIGGEGLGVLSGLVVSVVGDVVRSRVARSLLRLLPRLGAEVRLVGPAGFVPGRFGVLGVRVFEDLEAGLDGAHVVYCLRVQRERAGVGAAGAVDASAYADRYGMTGSRLERLVPGGFLMHPGPVNRGVEVDGSAVEHERSLVLRQVAMGVPTRQAVLLWLLGRETVAAGGVVSGS